MEKNNQQIESITLSSTELNQEPKTIFVSEGDSFNLSSISPTTVKNVSLIIKSKDNQELLKVEENGDVFIEGKLVGNCQKINQAISKYYF